MSRYADITNQPGNFAICAFPYPCGHSGVCKQRLIYRCGGSAGFAALARRLTGFPFHSQAPCGAGEHLNSSVLSPIGDNEADLTMACRVCQVLFALIHGIKAARFSVTLRGRSTTKYGSAKIKRASAILRAVFLLSGEACEKRGREQYIKYVSDRALRHNKA